jgi:hypothetical protein
MTTWIGLTLCLNSVSHITLLINFNKIFNKWYQKYNSLSKKYDEEKLSTEKCSIIQMLWKTKLSRSMLSLKHRQVISTKNVLKLYANNTIHDKKFHSYELMSNLFEELSYNYKAKLKARILYNTVKYIQFNIR